MNRYRAVGAGLVLLVTAACGEERSPDRDATERMFLETCAPGAADAEVAVCQCAFDRLTAGLSDEEVEELDRSVRGLTVDDLPDDVVAAAVECAAEPLTPPTPPPPLDEDEAEEPE